MKKIILASCLVLLSVTPVLAQIPSYVPTNGLVGWWPFNGNANDESGNGNNGTVIGAKLTSDRFSNVNSSYDFNGKDADIQITHNSSLNLNNDFTFSSWFNADSLYDVPGTVKMIISKHRNGTSSDGYAYGIWNNAKSSATRGMVNISAAPVFNISTYPKDSTGDVTIGKWINYVAAYSLTKGQIKYYLNGVLIDSVKANFLTSSNNLDVLIGSEWQISGSAKKNYFNGKIDDIGIWNRALSDKEVLALYNGETTCNLITSVTLTVPSITTVKAHGHIGYVNDASNKYHSPIDIAAWNYIAITKDNLNNANIYKNGKLMFQGKFDNVSYSWSRLNLGASYFTSYSGWFKGLIDEVRVSNKVRTASEISSSFSTALPFSSDANTIGLWHFDQSSGTTINATTGGAGSLTNAVWDAQGRFGQGIAFNGIDARAVLNQLVPTTNMTLEFWVKPFEIKYSVPIQMYGMNTSSYTLTNDTIKKQYQWSNSATGNSVTVNPSQMSYIWVTDGSCYDTIFFKSKSAVKYDTVKISVKDTLIIAVKYSSTPNLLFNNIKLYPNPTYSHLNIDFNDYSKIFGYNVEIMNTAGKSVYNSTVTQKLVSIDLSTWTGKGLYFVNIRDSAGKLLETKKIVLQ